MSSSRDAIMLYWALLSLSAAPSTLADPLVTHRHVYQCPFNASQAGGFHHLVVPLSQNVVVALQAESPSC
jgi:hypothetical protein